MGDLKLKSDFENDARIDSKYTCDGQDVSPPLDISGVPEEAESLVLVVDDPDAPVGTWDHWILFNIPVSTSRIEEGGSAGVSGKNSWGKLGYGGPCPPSGVHRYVFKLYALNTKLDLEEGASKDQIEDAMENHILAKTELVGVYSRS
ncbi:YbhB/YbcL family Raf kinase inhibitor-like protein [Nanoarchaeota archaeon]